MSRYLYALFFLCFGLNAHADAPIPKHTGWVVDATGTLSAEQQSTLAQTLEAFKQKKGAQISVLMVPTTQPETVEQYSLRVVEDWKLGRKKIDDGVLLLVAKDDRALRIEVGYGLEGALTDATSKRIIEDFIVPHFKEGNFYAGIHEGVQKIIQVVEGEPLPAADDWDAENADSRVLLLMLAIFMAPLVGRWLGFVPAAIVMGSGVGIGGFLLGLPILIAIIMALFAAGACAIRGGHGGGWSSGGGKWGGGGGFGGGGGGRSGGGGSSGRW